MAKIVRTTPAGRQEWELAAAPLTVGRRPDANIWIPDTFTSGQHARFGFDDGRYFVEDLKSSNGTRLNGAVLTRRALLSDGDVIQVGRATLKFVDSAAAPAPEVAAPAPPGTVPAAAPVAAPMPAAATPASAPPAASAPPPKPVPPAQPAAAPPPATPPLSAPEPAVAAPPAEPAPVLKPGETAAVELLDQLVGSIRSHRDREQQEREAAQALLRGEWEQTVVYAEQLKQKVTGDDRVKYFAISRRSNDVLIRAQRRPDAPVQFIQLSMEHPDQKGHPLSGVWMRRNHESDRCFATAREAIAELVREIAFLLA